MFRFDYVHERLVTMQYKKFIALILVLIIVIVLGIHILPKDTTSVAKNPSTTTETVPPKEAQKPVKVTKKENKKIDPLTCAILVKDKDFNGAVRTDTIFIMRYDPNTSSLKGLSVPRDTKITLSQEMYTELNSYRSVPGTMKINGLYTYSPREKWNDFVMPVLHEVTGVDIDHYVLVNIQLVKDLIDAIGGVTFNVPINMNYDDKYQNLHIHLSKGEQLLDGNKSEMLLRFRKNNDGTGYEEGDIQRIAVQQSFIKEFIKQGIEQLTITQIIDILKCTFENTETDMNLLDLVSYSTKYLPNFNPTDTRLRTLRGYDDYILDDLTTEMLAFEMDHNYSEDKKIDSKDLRIEVANGSYTNGFAGKNREFLASKGFTNLECQDFDGIFVPETRIITRKDGMGQELLEYYPDAILATLPDELPSEVDIMIILGYNTPNL